MIEIATLADISHLRESVDLEVKLGRGADGKGAIPRDFWPTYSAFANTHGGVILLGLREHKGEFVLEGVEDPEKLRADLFNTIESGKVSCNLLSERDVCIVTIDGKCLIEVRVPAATRKQKPVHLAGNPLGNTYRRLNDGDRKCDDDVVRRMLAEQVDDSRDTRILKGFHLADLALDSLRAYRNHFASLKPDHPWTALDELDFLRVNGCWRKDRDSGEEGFTLAGLLMFGQGQAVLEAAPLLFLDYQELPAFDDGETRWIDRIVPDGTWSGNLYDFYRKVAPRLMADLKVPFVMVGDTRQDDTPQHKALREALVNALVHADTSDRASIRIQKRPDGFVFRNPGTLRVPAEHALQGGESDCRNRTLHQLFLQLGLGERAGSGLPKIRAAWEPLGYSIRLYDSFEPYDQSILEMKRVEKLGSGPMSGDMSEEATSSEKSSEKMSEKPDGMSEKPSGAPVNAPVNAPENALEVQIPDETSEKTGPGSEKSSEKTEDVLLALLRTNSRSTIAAMAENLGLSTRGVEKQLQRLQQSGRLRRIGPDKGGHWEVLP